MFKIISLIVLFVGAFVFDLFWELDSEVILKEFRLPRIVSVVIAGGGLSLCGLLLQTLFKNPIVGPNILGISNGAGLGVALAILGVNILGVSFSKDLLVAYGFIGAGIITLLLLYFSYRSKSVSALLILGVILSSLTIAIVTFLQYLAPSEELKKFVFWSMGSVHGVTNQHLLYLSIGVFFAVIPLFFCWKQLDISLLGDDEAKLLGVSIQSLKYIVLFVVAVITGVVTVYMGNIAFIGLIAPHIVRNWFKTYSHKWLLPASFLLGALLLLICDALSSYAFPTLLPINVFTSLIASPLIIRYLFKKGFV